MADVLAGSLRMVRNADEVYPFDAPAGTTPPTAAAFTVSDALEGASPAGFPVTMAGGGITVTTGPAGAVRLLVSVPKALTRVVPVGTPYWSLWDLSSPDVPVAAGELVVVQTARAVG